DDRRRERVEPAARPGREERLLGVAEEERRDARDQVRGDVRVEEEVGARMRHRTPDERQQHAVHGVVRETRDRQLLRGSGGGHDAPAAEESRREAALRRLEDTLALLVLAHLEKRAAPLVELGPVAGPDRVVPHRGEDLVEDGVAVARGRHLRPRASRPRTSIAGAAPPTGSGSPDLTHTARPDAGEASRPLASSTLRSAERTSPTSAKRATGVESRPFRIASALSTRSTKRPDSGSALPPEISRTWMPSPHVSRSSSSDASPGGTTRLDLRERRGRR